MRFLDLTLYSGDSIHGWVMKYLSASCAVEKVFFYVLAYHWFLFWMLHLSHVLCFFHFEIDYEVKTFFKGKRKEQVDFLPFKRISCFLSERMFWNKSNKVPITEQVCIWIMSCLMIAFTYAPNKTKPKKNLGYNFWNWGELDGEKKSSSDPEKVFSPCFWARFQHLWCD